MILIGGDTAAVSSAVTSGAAAAAGCLIDQAVMANLHPEVLEAIGRPNFGEVTGALGIVESFNVVSLIEAADAAVKTASVTLLELRLAMALGGKAIAVVTGDIASVNSSTRLGECWPTRVFWSTPSSSPDRTRAFIGNRRLTRRRRGPGYFSVIQLTTGKWSLGNWLPF